MKRDHIFTAFLVVVVIVLSSCAHQQQTTDIKAAYTNTPNITPTPPEATSISSVAIESQYESIHEAARYCDVEAVKWYLENGVSVNSKDPDMGGAPLHWAASFGCTEVVRLLVENGADLTQKESHGATPLHMAAESGQLHVSSFIVENDKDTLYEADDNGALPIHIAAANGHKPIVSYFLSQGVDINILDNHLGGTPLHYAAFTGRTSMISYLMQQGADPLITDSNGDTAQDLAVNQNHEMAAAALADWGTTATSTPMETSTTVPTTIAETNEPSSLCEITGKTVSFEVDLSRISVGSHVTVANCGEDYGACPTLNDLNEVSSIDYIELTVDEENQRTTSSLILLLKISVANHPVSSRNLWEFFDQSRIIVQLGNGETYDIKVDPGAASSVYGGFVYYIEPEYTEIASPFIGLRIPTHDIIPLVAGEHEFIWCYDNKASQPLDVHIED
jgi:hypothetical protein